MTVTQALLIGLACSFALLGVVLALMKLTSKGMRKSRSKYPRPDDMELIDSSRGQRYDHNDLGLGRLELLLWLARPKPDNSYNSIVVLVPGADVEARLGMERYAIGQGWQILEPVTLNPLEPERLSPIASIRLWGVVRWLSSQGLVTLTPMPVNTEKPSQIHVLVSASKIGLDYVRGLSLHSRLDVKP